MSLDQYLAAKDEGKVIYNHLILPFASNRKIQTFFHVRLRFKRTRWAGQTCMLTRSNQLV